MSSNISDIVKFINDNVENQSLNLTYKEWESSILQKHVFAIDFSFPNIPDKTVEQSWVKNLLWIEKHISMNQPWLLATRIPTHEVWATRALENSGFHIIETLIQFDHSLKNIHSVSGINSIRPFFSQDIPFLRKIAQNSFQFSRFHMDPEIDTNLANLSRSEWVKNACLGRAQMVLIAEEEQKIVGFVICMKKQHDHHLYGQLDLIAVDSTRRGQKIGLDLTTAFLRYCQEQGYSYARVGTQIHNIPSIRMYEKAGFFMSQGYYTYHKHSG